uniref:NADH-ubiquinone oxidoreductase chain 4L n=1 Tax=Phyllomimus detersus TaxID=948396 RepID=A0A0N9LYQ5_9ORTH|nr:NADH dehydrogenase subunit 4L [Phyllomimus detersus]ALG66360.1 NADH dehydrogenase subunit 4L [Phyllomimus detersus]
MVMMFNLLILIFIMLGGIWVFCSNRSHLLAMLLSLEFMVLSMFLLLFVLFNFFDSEIYFLMLFLSFCVCEGALGLSILVLLIRTHGNDYFQSFSILQC